MTKKTNIFIRFATVYTVQGLCLGGGALPANPRLADTQRDRQALTDTSMSVDNFESSVNLNHVFFSLWEENGVPGGKEPVHIQGEHTNAD